MTEIRDPMPAVPEGLELVELDELQRRDWLDLTGRDRTVFGASTAELIYRPKDRYVAWQECDGRLAAAVGATVVTVEVGRRSPFEVVGIGSLIVRSDLRGKGLSGPLSSRTRRVARTMGPDRTLIFCEPELMSLHARRGYLPVDAPVWVDQPDGPVEMPVPAMWRPERPSEWPDGPVRVHGLPF